MPIDTPGFASVTAAEPVSVEFATLVAVTVRVTGTCAGAVKPE